MFDINLFNEISASSAPQKLLIVPAQLTLSAEQAAFDILGKGNDEFGFFDLQIMSGNKLRAEILNKTGGPGKTAVNTLGRSMILRKCVKDADLDVYAKMTESEDFLSSAADFIVQLKQSMNDIPKTAEGELLGRKLSDMSKIYERYQGFMEGKYIDSEDGLLFAAQKARECEWIKNSEIWFAGFYSFTAREQLFLDALNDASIACHVKIDTLPEAIPHTLKSVFECSGPTEQAKCIAAEILKLIREEKIDPEDITILSGNIASDGPVFKRLFEDFGISLYTDEKRSLMHLDAASKIAALLGMAADGLRPQTVSIYMGNEDLDKYIKLYHIKPADFKRPFRYGGEKKIEAETARDEFASKTLPFIEDLKALKTVREKTECLYHFLSEVLDLPSKMHDESVALSDAGYTEAAEELAQGWGVIINVFDQAVELLGEERLSNSEFRDLICNAFKDIKIGILPQRSGCIVLGDLYRTKLDKSKLLFVTSFNDGSVPRINNAEGILTDAEQKKLAAHGLRLCKPYEQLNKEDKACIFQALYSAERLYLSYCLTDSEGCIQRPSYLLKAVPKEFYANTSAQLYSLDELVSRLRDYKIDSEELSDEWKAVAAEYEGHPRYKAALRGLLYKNEAYLLDDASREKILRPNQISPSGLEKYARCPYAYFLSYGIRPDEERAFSIDGRNAGDIHHELLLRLSQWLSSDGKPVSSADSKWSTVSDDEIKAFIEHNIEEIKENDASGLLSRGEEEDYRMSRICGLASSFAIQMVKQVRLGNIDRIIPEQSFSISFAGVKLIGKIDRIDLTSLSDKELVKIIDYKSGKTSFNTSLIEEGLSIQLMLYLEAATKDGAEAIGSFYFHIENPSTGVEIERLAEAADQSLFALDGAYAEDKIIYADKTATAEHSSEILKKSMKMSSEEYEKLREKFRNSLSESISRLCRGDISISPRMLGQSDSACSYCTYKAICNFDKDTEGFCIN